MVPKVTSNVAQHTPTQLEASIATDHCDNGDDDGDDECEGRWRGRWQIIDTLIIDTRVSIHSLSIHSRRLHSRGCVVPDQSKPPLSKRCLGNIDYRYTTTDIAGPDVVFHLYLRAWSWHRNTPISESCLGNLDEIYTTTGTRFFFLCFSHHS